MACEEKMLTTQNTSPGPGNYKIPCSFQDVPKYLTTTGNFTEEFKYV